MKEDKCTKSLAKNLCDMSYARYSEKMFHQNLYISFVWQRHLVSLSGDIIVETQNTVNGLNSGMISLAI